MWNRSTVGLMVGSAMAGFGAWVDLLAILTLASYVLGASPVQMAFVSALLIVPGMVLGPRVGSWIDRNDAIRILKGSLLLRAGVTTLLVFSHSITFFCALVALRSLTTIPTEPASNRLVSRFVERDDVPRYFGTLSVLRNVSKIGAPALGALVASQLGESTAVLFSAGMTIVAVLVLQISLRDSTKPGSDVGGNATTKKQGASPPAAWSKEDPRSAVLGQLLRVVAIYSFMVFLVNNQLPVLLRNGGFDKALLGILVSCSGAGGILAALVMSRKTSIAWLSSEPMRATVWSVAATSTCFVLLGLVFRLPTSAASILACSIFFATGIFSSVEAIRSNTVVVQQFSDSVATITARVQRVQSGAILVAPWVAAAIIPFVSMSLLFLLDGSIALAALVATTYAYRRAHNLGSAPMPTQEA